MYCTHPTVDSKRRHARFVRILNHNKNACLKTHLSDRHLFPPLPKPYRHPKICFTVTFPHPKSRYNRSD